MYSVGSVRSYLCRERIHPNIGVMTDKLIECDELHVSDETEFKLRAVSLGTLKNLITNVQKQEGGRVGGMTKPGTLLKSEIPLRVGYWDEKQCGFLEIDLVAHCGDSAAGEFINTLNTTDIATGWFEAEAVLGKAQSRVFEGLKAIRTSSVFLVWHRFGQRQRVHQLGVGAVL